MSDTVLLTDNPRRTTSRGAATTRSRRPRMEPPSMAPRPLGAPRIEKYRIVSQWDSASTCDQSLSAREEDRLLPNAFPNLTQNQQIWFEKGLVVLIGFSTFLTILWACNRVH
jgi:hypothetical protein